MMTSPEISAGRVVPRVITSGCIALRTACFQITLRSAHALGAGRLHVLLAQHVEQVGAHDPGQRGRAPATEITSTGIHRWDSMSANLAELQGALTILAGEQPAHLHGRRTAAGEHQHHQGEQELRDRDADELDHRDDVVRQGVAVGGRVHAERDRDPPGDDRSRTGRAATEKARRPQIRSADRLPVVNDCPKSPGSTRRPTCRTSRSSGSLTPYCSSRAAICSVETVLPRLAAGRSPRPARDPGASSMMKKLSSETGNNVMTA